LIAQRACRIPSLIETPPPFAYLCLGGFTSIVLLLTHFGFGASRLVFLPPVLFSLAWTLLGTAVARLLAAPISLLYFALPAWGFLDVPLQSATTWAVNVLIAATHLPAFVEGNFIHLARGSLEVALGCSGLNYLITALALFGYYCAAHIRRASDAILILAFAAALAIAGNWLRVYALVVVAHWSDMQHYLIKVDHHYFGWILFGVSMVPVLRFAIARERSAYSAADKKAASANIPGKTTAPRALPIAGVIITFSILAAALAFRPAGPASSTTAPELPYSLGPWSRKDSFRNAIETSFPGADLAFGVYRHSNGSEIELHRAIYTRQTGDSRLFGRDNAALTSDWIVVAQSSRSVSAGVVPVPVEQLEVVRNGERRVVWFAQTVAGIPVSSRWQALQTELAGLLRADTSAVVLVLTAACDADCTAAEQSLTGFFTQATALLALEDDT
jgi:EpsI family protein